MTKKQQYISFIISELEKGKSYKETSLVFLSKFKLSEPTFVKYWKLANEDYSKTLDKVREAKEAVYIENEVKATKDALKTKHERMLLIQKELLRCYENLDTGMTDDNFLTGNPSNKEPKQYRRKMTIDERNKTRKTAKELSAELSKLNGEYEKHNKDKATTINIIK